MYETRPCPKGLRILAACTIMGIFYLLVPRGLRAQEKVGYILDVQGCWAVAGNSQCLKRGDSVKPGVLMGNTAAKPSDTDRIVIADLKGDAIKRIRCKNSLCNECRKSGTCYDPIQPLPQLPPPPSVLRASFEGLMALFSSKPERFSVHRVRGETLSDTVAQVSEERIYLGQVLNGLKGGPYHLIFIRIDRNGDLSDWKSDPVEVGGEHIDANQTVIRGLHPGLYEANLDTRDFSKNLWVLFVNNDAYANLNDAFRRISIAIETWGDEVPANIKDSYRRAYLAYLDQQLEVKSAERIQ